MHHWEKGKVLENELANRKEVFSIIPAFIESTKSFIADNYCLLHQPSSKCLLQLNSTNSCHINSIGSFSSAINILPRYCHLSVSLSRQIMAIVSAKPYSNTFIAFRREVQNTNLLFRTSFTSNCHHQRRRPSLSEPNCKLLMNIWPLSTAFSQRKQSPSQRGSFVKNLFFPFIFCILKIPPFYLG